jgi:hypothetical protein
MARTARYTLTTTPTQLDVAADDNIPQRTLTVVAQEAGTVVVCDDDTTDPTTEGARVILTAGSSITFDKISGGEDVWLAVAAGTLAVDVIETGVA